MSTNTIDRKEADRKQAAYLLPMWLIRKIRREAADRGVYPAHILIERMADSYERQPPKPAA